jgi:type 1 glutamine amidotransferase
VIGSMAPGENAFDRIEEIADADVMLVSVVRRAPPKAQLDAIRRYIMKGRPIVGIRTAGHAFALSPGQKLPAGGADWPAWDAEVIGGHYSGHYRTGPVATITATQPDHPILRGVALPFTFNHQLYKVNPLRPGATAILIATLPDQAPEPVAWTFTHIGGGRTFYTSLGTTADFKNPAFTTLLRNGILWAAGNAGQK